MEAAATVAISSRVATLSGRAGSAAGVSAGFSAGVSAGFCHRLLRSSFIRGHDHLLLRRGQHGGLLHRQGLALSSRDDVDDTDGDGDDAAGHVHADQNASV